MDEWMFGIVFLTAPVTVDRLAARIHPTLRHARTFDAGRNAQPTTRFGERNPVAGPFYIANSPATRMGQHLPDGRAPVWVEAAYDAEGRPIAGATPGRLQAKRGWLLRLQRKPCSRYEFARRLHLRRRRSLLLRLRLPRYYPIPFDGSVGDMLRALDRNAFRPAPPAFHRLRSGFERVTTHISRRLPLVEGGRVFAQGEASSPIRTSTIRSGETIGMPNPLSQLMDSFLRREP